MIRSLIPLVAAFALGGCATSEKCFEAHSSGIKVTNSAGGVIFERLPDTVVYCPAYVSPAASAAQL